jgi:ATP-dependent Lhr-like helicase
MLPDPAGLAAPAGHAATVLEALRARGALFHAELVALTGLGRDQVDEALWSLVASARVTSDGFQALRSLAGESGTRRAGRWALLEGPRAEAAAAAEKFARTLLDRYGVLFRELVPRETLPPWRDVLVCLRRMEARGEIRGGRFVSGFVGEQFGLPIAVETMRAKKGEAAAPITLAARDPLQVKCLLPAVDPAPAPSPVAHA